jgi:opacity protein-like surface antigen
VTGGVAIVLVATWILDRLIHTSSKAADPIDITKLSFTVAGGVGAAVALVVA